jgi:hypothetical protein
MPFKAGNQYGKANKGKPKQSRRTIWLLESLKENGYNYEAMLVKFLKEKDFKMAELLIRMVPHIANAPKQDVSIDGVETLVINRYKQPDEDNKE